jgi:ankyrin repeat protein
LWYVVGGNSYLDAKKHADRGKVVALLVHAGANLNAQDQNGDSVLNEAYDTEIVRVLIENGADVNLRNAKGETPLMANFDLDAAKLLVAAGADVTLRDTTGKTALDHARDLEPDGERTKFLAAVAARRAKH